MRHQVKSDAWKLNSSHPEEFVFVKDSVRFDIPYLAAIVEDEPQGRPRNEIQAEIPRF